MTALYTHEIAPCEINLRYNLGALVIHVGRAVDKFKRRFNLGLHTPDDIIRQHQKSALRQLVEDTGVPRPPQVVVEEWNEAWDVKTYILVVPHLNLFTLEDAPAAERLLQSGGATGRFLGMDEINQAVKLQRARYCELVTTITKKLSADKPQCNRIYVSSHGENDDYYKGYTGLLD